MILNKAVELATNFTRDGHAVHLKPEVYTDPEGKESLHGSVTIPDIEHLTRKHLEMLLRTCEEFDCEILIKNDMVVFR